jgi:CheY-like chemotaxis protein
MTGDREKVLAAGIDEYLAKPIKWSDLRCLLERLRVTAIGNNV